MKKLIMFILLTAVTMNLRAWENNDWLTEYDWYIEMEGNGPHGYIYWHPGTTPYGEFGKFEIQAKSIVYRNRLRNESFKYFYQTEDEKIFFIGHEKDDNGNEIEFSVVQRNNYSYMSIASGWRLYIGGNRNGGQYEENHPLVGIWGELPSLSEIRLVKPDNYVYYLTIDKIPVFAVRYGTYLFKQINDNVFETDSCFPDGYMRLEIKNRETLLLTPLFELPKEDGLVEPLVMRRLPKGQRYSGEE